MNIKCGTCGGEIKGFNEDCENCLKKEEEKKSAS